ncbi:30S ribosomal protein S3 [Rickettsiaceae bacterium]|jgi:small subunit ribosomal protein S3|nr:30S ribosomal protein S3 [Rickettsiaceae bacterium]
MGQKVNPNGFRIGPTLYKNWDSILYAKKDYAEKLLQDLRIRSLIMKRYKVAQVGRVVIQRPSGNVLINIHAKKPGVIIGKSGSDIEKLKKDIQKIVTTGELFINIHEVKKPAIDSTIVAQTIAQQLENRISFRKAMKTAIQNCFKQGGKGIKVACSGRLGGAEIARTEWYREGVVSLHTLRADVDYGTAEAITTYGVIGVKVWVYKGEHTKYKKVI